MKIISLPLREVIDITGNQPSFGCVSRKSSFYFDVKVDKGFILYNSLTKECLYVDDSEYNNDELKNTFTEKWFYVPLDFDETKFVDEIRDVINYTLCQTQGFVSYTILTTTDCNARCFYCFEANSKKIMMSDETIGKVLDYIERTRCKDSKLTLQWFGGEPLYNKKAINSICRCLKEKGVEYASSMISNGYLFDKETICEAKDLWNLNNVQITLDGTEKTYNKVKAYVYKDVNAYERVLQNIDNLLSAEISVSIRLNIDAYNIQDMRCLVNELALRYKGKKGLSVYTHTLFEEVGKCGGFVRTQERRKEICELQKALEDEIASLGLAHSTSRMLNKRFMDHFCMADAYGSIVILPDGHLTKCESSLDDNFVGHIDNDSLDEKMLAKYSRHCEKLEECKTCVLYPDCIKLEVCHEAGKCYEEFRNKRISDLKEAVLNEYHAFLEREKENANNEDKVS